MINLENVIKGLEICSEHGSWHGLDCEHNGAYKDCPYRGCETGCVVTIAKDALTLLKEQEEQIKKREESIEKAREEIEWLRGIMKEQDAVEPIPPTDESDLWKCGNCNNQLFRCTYQVYCEKCGSKVKWHDT